MISRRYLFLGLGGLFLGLPNSTIAQNSDPARSIGILMPYHESDAVIQARVAALREELRKLGSKAGPKLELHERWATDNLEKVRAATDELVKMKVDLIVTTGSRVIPIVQKATRSIPIIFVGTSDPVGQGLVASLAHPGGNTTGFSLLEFSGGSSPLMGKLVGFLKQAVPDTTRIGFMFNPANPASSFHSRGFMMATANAAVQGILAPIQSPPDIEIAIQSLAREPHTAMLLPSDLTLLGQRKAIVELMARNRLPAAYSDRSFVESGGLMSYSADRTEMFRRAASYVFRILGGENAGELPVQQPTRYELVINLTTAKALGINVPALLLAQADEVIE